MDIKITQNTLANGQRSTASHQRFGKKVARGLQDDPRSGTEIVANVVLREELKRPDSAQFSPGRPTLPEHRLRSVPVTQPRFEQAAEGQPAIVSPPVRSGKTSGVLSSYISVDREGRVREAYALNADNPGLQDAVRDLLLECKLKPMVKNGVLVQGEPSLTFRFETTLPANDAPPAAPAASTPAASHPAAAVPAYPGTLSRVFSERESPSAAYPPEASEITFGEWSFSL